MKRHAERVQSRYELREEHEAKKAKLEDAAKSESRAASEPQAIEGSPGGVKRSEEAMSPTSSSPKRWRTEGHMRYKREAEVPAEALDPRVAGDPAAEASEESLSLPATAEVVRLRMSWSLGSWWRRAFIKFSRSSRRSRCVELGVHRPGGL